MLSLPFPHHILGATALNRGTCPPDDMSNVYKNTFHNSHNTSNQPIKTPNQACNQFKCTSRVEWVNNLGIKLNIMKNEDTWMSRIDHMDAGQKMSELICKSHGKT